MVDGLERFGSWVFRLPHQGTYTALQSIDSYASRLHIAEPNYAVTNGTRFLGWKSLDHLAWVMEDAPVNSHNLFFEHAASEYGVGSLIGH